MSDWSKVFLVLAIIWLAMAMESMTDKSLLPVFLFIFWCLGIWFEIKILSGGPK